MNTHIPSLLSSPCNPFRFWSDTSPTWQKVDSHEIMFWQIRCERTPVTIHDIQHKQNIEDSQLWRPTWSKSALKVSTEGVTIFPPDYHHPIQVTIILILVIIHLLWVAVYETIAVVQLQNIFLKWRFLCETQKRFSNWPDSSKHKECYCIVIMWPKKGIILVIWGIQVLKFCLHFHRQD